MGPSTFCEVVRYFLSCNFSGKCLPQELIYSYPKTMEMSGLGDEWTTVSRKRKTKQTSSKEDDYRRIHDLATTFFVANIPYGWSAADLWRRFQHCGHLVDAYVAQKNNRMGLRFGFVRFAKVGNEREMERFLNGVTAGGQSLQVNIARFQRKKTFEVSSIPSFVLNRKEADRRRVDNYAAVSSSIRGRKSYADVVGGMSAKYAYKEDVREVIKIPDCVGPASHSWLDGCLVGEAKDLDMLESFFGIFKSSGLVDCSLKYLGGLNILLEFGRKNVADAFLRDHSEGWKKWFAWLCPWDVSRIQTQRIVWLKISGVPVHCWDQNIFDVIASRFGRVLIPNECSKEAIDLSHGRVCILTRHNLIFNVCHEVVWKKLSFIIRVQEEGDWAPPCVSDESSVSDSEDDDYVDRNSLGIMDDCEDEGMGYNLHNKNMEAERNEDDCEDRSNNNVPATVVADSAEVEQGKGSGESQKFAEMVPVVLCDDSTSKVEGNEAVGHEISDNIADKTDTHAVGHVMYEDMGDNIDGLAVGPSINSKLGFGIFNNNSSEEEACAAGHRESLHNGLPDLNVGIRPNRSNYSDNSNMRTIDASSVGGSSRRKSLSARRLSHSIRFKDVVWASHGNICSDSISMSSCDREVEKTVELGEILGFRIKNSKSSLRAVIEGEGDIRCVQ